VARSASLGTSRWLPSYAWWPPTDEYGLTVVLSPYHVTTERGAEFEATIRGLAGPGEPLFEHRAGVFRFGDEVAIELDQLEIPGPPGPNGGVVEIHAIRLDRPPHRTVDFLGHWVHAEGREGGGYIIPTIPVRGQEKHVQRDDLQVLPGVMSSPDVETEIVLLNPIDAPVEARITVSSPSGMVVEGVWFTVEPWSAWRSALSDALPRVRRMLAEDGGVGSAAVYSSHKVLPYFGFRGGGMPLSCMDHAAPMFT
jgi:hypothetical protein